MSTKKNHGFIEQKIHVISEFGNYTHTHKSIY